MIDSFDLTDVAPAGSRRRWWCCLADEPLDLEFCMATTIGGTFQLVAKRARYIVKGLLLPQAAMFVFSRCSAEAKQYLLCTYANTLIIKFVRNPQARLQISLNFCQRGVCYN